MSIETSFDDAVREAQASLAEEIEQSNRLTAELDRATQDLADAGRKYGASPNASNKAARLA